MLDFFVHEQLFWRGQRWQECMEENSTKKKKVSKTCCAAHTAEEEDRDIITVLSSGPRDLFYLLHVKHALNVT